MEAGFANGNASRQVYCQIKHTTTDGQALQVLRCEMARKNMYIRDDSSGAAKRGRIGEAAYPPYAPAQAPAPAHAGGAYYAPAPAVSVPSVRANSNCSLGLTCLRSCTLPLRVTRPRATEAAFKVAECPRQAPWVRVGKLLLQNSPAPQGRLAGMASAGGAPRAAQLRAREQHEGQPAVQHAVHRQPGRGD